jgi:broad specificity phosphatase PhoE
MPSLIAKNGALLFALIGLPYCQAFITICPTSTCKQTLLRGTLPSEEILADKPEADNEYSSQKSRREMLASAASSLAYFPVYSSLEANAIEKKEAVFFNSLSDLPPLADDNVRIFLCRHGQTENNRLKLIQGSRLDPSINETGQEQARRLGKALSFALPVVPTIVFHSPLIRARQTAQIAALQFSSNPSVSSPTLRQLDSLNEIDFGSAAEGESVEPYRAKMMATYAGWSVGELDLSMGEGGETGGEVLARIEKSLQDLAKSASNASNRCVAAIAHSTFLKILLATAQNIPLAQVAMLEQKNCCVNVLDFSTKQAINLASRSELLGGPLSLAPLEFTLSIPKTAVIRMNEKRHLGDLAI